MRRGLPLALALLSASSLAAQRLTWGLGVRTAALYERKLQLVDEITDPAPEAGKKARPTGFHGQQPASPLLFGGELDPTRSFPELPVLDLREVGMRVAFDLRFAKVGKATLPIEASSRFNATNLDLVCGPIDKTGTQEITGSFAVDSKRKDPRFAGGYPADIVGKLVLKRTLDTEGRRVSAFTSDLDVVLVQSKPLQPNVMGFLAAHVSVADSWTWTRDLTPEEAEFRTRVIEAIRKGLANLLAILPGQTNTPEANINDYANGQLALVLLALLKGGESPFQPEIAAGLTELARRDITDTYSLSVAIMAIEAIYAPSDEREMLRKGVLKAPVPRKPSAEHKALLAEWTKRLLLNIDSTVDPAYTRRWHYHPSKSFDNSNTQYAMLGLYAAQLCGIEVSPQIWFASANHWLAMAQRQKGETFNLQTETALEAGKTQRTISKQPNIQVVGWGYSRGSTPTGSMTCAGVTGLTLCIAGLRLQKKGDQKLVDEAEAALLGGYAWLAKHLTVRGNPPDPASWSSWHFYYLYGLERSCELRQIARLQDRDWYFEGALELMARQQVNGAFGPGGLADTCFAILFLKRVALPAITPGR